MHALNEHFQTLYILHAKMAIFNENDPFAQYSIIIKFGMGHISNQSENLTPHPMIVTHD